MEKRLMRGLVVMGFVGALLFFVTSCAKKQVDVSEGINPAEAKEQAMESQAPKEEVVDEKGLSPEMVKKITEFQNEKIYFDFDKSNLKPESQTILKKKATFLRDNPSYDVLIEGNCDNRGTEEYNLALGERRAASARDFLMALGIASSRIKMISYGELRPADPRNNEAAWAANRRDEFKLYK